MNTEVCKYCNHKISKNRPIADESICMNCYNKRKLVRRFIRVTQPLRDYYIKKQNEAFIEGIEFSIDNGLYVPPEAIKKYIELTKEQKK